MQETIVKRGIRIATGLLAGAFACVGISLFQLIWLALDPNYLGSNRTIATWTYSGLLVIQLVVAAFCLWRLKHWLKH